MFQDFKNAVLNSYAEKKATNQLSDNLLNPTKAKLKKECLLILKNRYLKKDDEALKAFFDPTAKFDNLELSITKFELDGFAALKNFLLGQPDIRREETIKLLAWLIDFEQRPYIFGDIYVTQEINAIPFEKKEPDEVNTLPEKRTESIDENLNIEKEEPEEVKVIAPVSTKRPWKSIAAVILSLFIITIYSYISINKEGNNTSAGDANFINQDKQIPVLFANKTEQKSSTTKPFAKERKECMYWINDHYEAINCNKVIGDTPKFVLNTQQVAHFKKINNPDTLTQNSVGKVYYIKMKNTIEYYTSEGFHPIHTERKLKKLTPYMLNKYILSK